MSDIVERLRAPLMPRYGVEREAADTIEALRAENAELKRIKADYRRRMSSFIFDYKTLEDECDVMRAENAKLLKALKPFADCDVWEGYKDEETFVSGLKIGDLRAARAAIGETE